MAERRLSGTVDLVGYIGTQGASSQDRQRVAAALKLPCIYLAGAGRPARSFTRIFGSGPMDAGTVATGAADEDTFGTAVGAATL